MKRRVYPVNSIEEADILIISGIAKFNNIGFYVYNMRKRGELISLLEQNIDSSTIQIQSKVKKIVTCDKDIFLTVSDDMIKLW